ncbi:hypothetical protein M9435_003607 [Picochlorum sp. BPE23]|nr:hypothetical protein M9435_003607 [Picochlorum sp. BPE23]
MGVGLRRVAEKMRQATGLGERNFQRTSNQRNESMMKEAHDFASHLKKCDKAISDMKSSCESMLSTTKIAMAAPLPRLYEDTAAVSGASVKSVESIGGSGFRSEEFGRLSQTASASIESQVLVPIKRWLDVFHALNARMKEVEALRLEVDSRRHTVIDLASSVDKQRAKLGKVGGHDAKLEAHLDDTIKKLQHKEGKLTLAVQSYQEKEQALYSDLSTLIKDAAWLRHYIASALKVQGDALIGAAGALGENTRPDTSVSMSGLSLGSKGTQGTVSTNTAQPSTQQSDDTEKKSAAHDTEIEAQPSGSPKGEQAPATSEGTSNPFLSSGVIPQ